MTRRDPRFPTPRNRATLLPALLALIPLVGCEEVEQARDHFRDLTPHEAYRASLAAAGLDDSALGRDWVRAARTSLERAPAVSLPFQERGFITPGDPDAVAFRIDLPRGQRLHADIALTSEESTRVFVDLFRLPEDPRDPPRPLLSTDSVPGTIAYEPARGGSFVLRLQPELLRGGSWEITLRAEAQLAFPVQGRDAEAIQSFFGADRDGGARSHHGVDIFAPRGTPVLAAAEGVVGRIQVTNLGGKVVWLRDAARSASVYYAHLDSQYVRDGRRVRVGDTLGFVGNTGNARTTPPHLHFGIYRRGEGPIDPAPWIRAPRGRLAPALADPGRLGHWVRISRPGAALFADPEGVGGLLMDLDPGTPVHVLGAAGDAYRVRLPDGAEGYLRGRSTESADPPLATRRTAEATSVHSSPRAEAPVVEELDPATDVPVLGSFRGWTWVRTPSGREAWLGAAPPL